MKKLIFLYALLSAFLRADATMNEFIFQVEVANAPGGPFSSHFCICQGGTVYVKNVSSYQGGPYDPCGTAITPCQPLAGSFIVETWLPSYLYATFNCSAAPGGTWNYGEVVAVTLANHPISGSCASGHNVYFQYSESTSSETSPYCSDPNFYHDMLYGFTYAPATANAGADVHACAGQSVTLTATGVGTPDWSGPGVSCTNCPSITVNPTTTSTYTLTTTTSCSSASDQVTVIIDASVDLGPDLVACYGTMPLLNAGNGMSSYTWTQPPPGNCLFGGQNMSACNAGEYCVTVTQNGCTGTDCINVSFEDCTPCGIDAYFWMLQQSLNCETILFYDGSVSNPYTTVTGWLWSFGDGTTSTDQNPVHSYYYNGGYEVTMTIFGVDDEGNCCSASYRRKISIMCPCKPQKPYVTVTQDANCTVNLSESSSTLGTSHIIAWQWNFGDGTQGYGQNISHTYATSGTYTITCTVTAFNGDECCSVEPWKNDVTVKCDNEKCEVNAEFIFSIDYGYVDFFDLSTTGPGTIITGYLWEFDDGGTSNLQNPEHTYLAIGTYEVCLTVFGFADGHCCSNKICHNVEITEIAQFQQGGNKLQNPGSNNFEKAWLGQNKPNPFSDATTIGCYVPDGSVSAALLVYNMTGKMIESRKINQRGHISIDLSLGEYTDGLYTYCLVIDDVKIGSKQMAVIR